MKYSHSVYVDRAVTAPDGSKHYYLYRGGDIADAMAAYSKAIADGAEYVTLESMLETGQ